MSFFAERSHWCTLFAVPQVPAVKAANVAPIVGKVPVAEPGLLSWGNFRCWELSRAAFASVLITRRLHDGDVER